MPSPPPTALALSQPRLSGWPVALLSPAREPKVFWDFWRSWGLAVRRRSPGRHGSMGQGSGTLLGSFFHSFCVWIGFDEIAEVDGPTETKTNSSL
jgi:hypothetical protein